MKPEIRNLNLREERQSLLINKRNVVEKQKVQKKNNDIKNRVNTVFDKTNNKYDESSIDSDNEGSDIIDDDFNMKEKIF